MGILVVSELRSSKSKELKSFKGEDVKIGFLVGLLFNE
jgi:hypothetical protein